MTNQHARIKINLAQREIEIEGAENFVSHWADRLDELLGYFGNSEESRQKAEEDKPEGPRQLTGDDLGAFGEFIQSLPNASTEVDKMLAAGLWVQRRSNDDAFGTGDASRHLADHGMRIGNPSQCVRQSLMAKRLFMVQRGRYRISQQGYNYLRQLIGPSTRI
ncbi:hypothetical protein SAMN07250955_105255 [Arboricoccus pini]|uniref:Uncharacterized protein n=1 Tax=Arboricoccus pini TaxID=1963835 RepID=A0A212R5F8_9PROT|nr:hypothetical protein [Arboricoccus pini]SNB67098.1 hypothetical protein SAMN07250955_105255 [Arboricoccus pini]